MTLNTHENIFYPPVGIVHITDTVGKLLEPHIAEKQGIHINTSAQPNSNPHLGTVTTLMTAFAIGEYLRSYFNLPVRLTFDQLENAPGEKQTADGIEYQKSLGDTMGDRGISLANEYMKSFRWVFDFLSQLTDIPYKICSYDDFQKKPAFRRNLLKILQNKEQFSSFLSPTDKVIRFRFPCPKCRWVDKSSKTTRILSFDEDHAVLSSRCFKHGEHQIILSEKSSDFIDTNTPLRDVAKGATLIEEGQHSNELMVMCDGGDWAGVWNMQVFCNGITRLGYPYESLPFRFFSPIITDWSGAKFSKSLYVKAHAYEYLPEGLINFEKFIEFYGKSGFLQLWEEVRSWPEEPKKLFRNYSIDYFQLMLQK
ncbi:hypothetical protein CWC29_014320 [Pseudoalteromonas sp. S4498]|uniref:hypothetical protein n=1 Tax=Pseudoalteromonas galatheae TaxID=579562 RepID=UPI0011093C66|nr:hypothetical protein [Pseudoalteromonas galatheae]NKC19988.1 hypothetical protein [Pseudoalteromonas galatheae]